MKEYFKQHLMQIFMDHVEMFTVHRQSITVREIFKFPTKQIFSTSLNFFQNKIVNFFSRLSHLKIFFAFLSQYSALLELNDILFFLN